jgi:hypothetical protein
MVVESTRGEVTLVAGVFDETKGKGDQKFDGDRFDAKTGQCGLENNLIEAGLSMAGVPRAAK